MIEAETRTQAWQCSPALVLDMIYYIERYAGGSHMAFMGLSVNTHVNLKEPS